MAITLGKNIQSLGVLRALDRTGSALSDTYTRLSSGLRINKASDDAAGLAVATSLNSHARVFTQGIRNLNDGVSLVSIASSALGSLQSINDRMSELAEQSANGVYSTKQRAALNQEGLALIKEYNRVINTTEFNGIKVFASTGQSVRIQDGTGTLGGIDVSLSGDLSRNVGNTVFTGGYSYYNGNTVHGVATADFNNDGKQDSASVSFFGNLLSVLLNTGNDASGNPIFSQTTYSIPGGSRAVTTGDFDGDGFQDIAVTSSSNGSVTIFKNNKAGGFTNVQTIGVGLYTDEIASGDFDGDGKDELIVGSFGGTAKLNNTNGVFSIDPTFSYAGSSNGITIGDVNGDGKLDAVIAGTANTTVNVFLNSGNGTLTLANTFAVGNSPYSIKLFDADLDGDLDLVTTNDTDQSFSIAMNNGSGIFTLSQTILNAGNAQSVTTGDFNGDGYFDIANSAGYISLNQGDGTFGTAFVSGVTGYQIASADFNGDGITDLLGNTNSSFNDQVFIQGKTKTNTVQAIDLTSQTSARNSLAILDSNRTRLSAQIGSLGASESRLNYATAALTSRRDEYKAAEARITDADIAQDSANLVRLQILQQAGVAVAAQANQQPALLLKLLRS